MPEARRTSAWRRIRCVQVTRPYGSHDFGERSSLNTLDGPFRHKRGLCLGQVEDAPWRECLSPYASRVL
jgi:hypothetical protein